MVALVDTNVLVYRFDKRFPAKQAIAAELLRRGIVERSVLLPHQAIVEFVSVVTRPAGQKPPLFTRDEALRQVEHLFSEFPVLYPTEHTVRTALRGAALYKLSWYDAHLWAYADERGIETIWSEDFADGQWYGRVRVRDPFRAAVHDAPAAYGADA